MRVYGLHEKTKLATGTNAAQPTNPRRQICTLVPEDLFNIVKAEAISQGTSISEVLRQCLEIVLK